jgi:adenine-specific DNA-methyltransferase
MSKNIKAYKHSNKLSHTPSTEEAGMEQNNPKVKDKELLNIPKNPVVHRGQDPELFWMNKYGDDEKDDRLNVDIRSLYRHEHIALNFY